MTADRRNNNEIAQMRDDKPRETYNPPCTEIRARADEYLERVNNISKYATRNPPYVKKGKTSLIPTAYLG
mgnify:CR=1 FL=1